MAEPKEPLTERELEVVQLVATGISNKEIAAQLHVSPNTVRVHLRNIFTKLEAQSRTEVTMIAIRNGWVAAPGDRASSDDGLAADNGAQSPGASSALREAPSLPAQPVPMQPVRVAPNPYLPPEPALWQRIASVVTLVAIIALTALALQRPAAEASPLREDAPLSNDNVNLPMADIPSAEATRWHARTSIRTARARAAIVSARGNIYVIGGEMNRTPSNEVLIYDPQRDDWRETTPKPTPVMNTGAAVIGNLLYVPGGTTADSLVTDRVEALDLTTNEWRVLPSLPQPIAGHAVVAYDDRLFVIGGRTLSGLNSATFVFDVARKRWATLAPIPTPRSQLAAAAVKGRIYAIGGYDGKREQAVCEYYQIAAGRWFSCAPMTIPRGGLGLAQVGSVLYAVGGGLSGFIGFNERYDTEADKWVPFEMPAPRMGDWRNVGVASLPTEFYVIGGSTRGVPLSDNYVYEVLNNRTFLPAFQSSGER